MTKLEKLQAKLNRARIAAVNLEARLAIELAKAAAKERLARELVEIGEARWAALDPISQGGTESTLARYGYRG